MSASRQADLAAMVVALEHAAPHGFPLRGAGDRAGCVRCLRPQPTVPSLQYFWLPRIMFGQSNGRGGSGAAP